MKLNAHRGSKEKTLKSSRKLRMAARLLMESIRAIFILSTFTVTFFSFFSPFLLKYLGTFYYVNIGKLSPRKYSHFGHREISDVRCCV